MKPQAFFLKKIGPLAKKDCRFKNTDSEMSALEISELKVLELELLEFKLLKLKFLEIEFRILNSWNSEF